MNANAVARHYGSLTPEERFRLILAASGRGDEAERTRLVSAAPRITLAMPDHSPFGHAFHELALLIFIELSDAAAYFTEALDAADFADFADEEAAEGEAAEGEEASELEKEGSRKRPTWQRFLDLALAFGFMLRTKADGWKLFCERMNVPPFLVWELGGLPGFGRLQRALALAEEAAFTPEGFLRWLNRIRPAGEPERADVPVTVEGMADAADRLFRERAAWWNGDAPSRP
jgi:hypothetical protein